MTLPAFGSTVLDDRVIKANTTDADVQAAKDMGEIRKSWSSGRIGNEVNSLRSQEAGLRSDGDVKGGEALAAKVAALKQRQGAYAPAVGKVEDIDGVGSGLQWLGGQMGQGAASSIDQLAAGTAIGGAATIAGLIPHPLAQTVSRGLRLAAPLAMYGMNVPQARGENYDAMTQNPTIMATHTPQELNSMAWKSGLASALLDTAAPAYMAHGFAGGGLKRGLRKLNPFALAGTEMLGEGATETAQELIKQRALTELDAGRDKSGDNSDLLNSFAGGAAGSSHMALASSMADAGYRRVGDTAERLGTAAGQGFDLAAEKAAPYIDQARAAGGKMFGKLKGQAMDLATGDDGKVSGQALVGNLKTGAQDMAARFQASSQEREILSGAMPAEMVADTTPAGIEKGGAWLQENDAKRGQLVATKLGEMALSDPEAKALLDNIMAAQESGAAQEPGFDAGAEFLLSRMPTGRAQERADKLGNVVGAVGGAIGRGAAKAGGVALDLGKAVFNGAKDGMRKKNEQTDQASDESFDAWRGQQYEGEAEAPATDRVRVPAEPEKASALKEMVGRANLAGSYASDMAGRGKMRGSEQLARRAAFSLADMIDSTDTGGATVMNDAGIDARVNRLNRIVDDFNDIYKDKAPQVLQQLGAILGPNAGLAVKHMLSELEQRAAPGGGQRALDARSELANQVVNLVGVSERSALMAQGVNLHEPTQANHLLGMLEDYADGIGTERGNSMRRTLDAQFGKEGMAQIMELLNGQPEKGKVGTVVDDRAQTAGEENLDPNADNEAPGGTAYEQAAAEKNVAKGSGPKMYGFHGETNLRTDTSQRDPFGAMEAPGDDGVARRPKLFTKGQQLFGGKGDAIEKKITDIKKQMIDDPEYAGHDKDNDFKNHDNHSVSAKSARDVMRDMGMQPGKILQLFRDYSHADYNNEKASPEERKTSARMSSLASKLIGDTVKMRESRPGETQQFRTTPAERKEVREAAGEYFKNRFVVVGEQLSNRDPSKIALTEMLDMHKAGEGLTERARKAGLEGDGAAALSDANILNFKSNAVKGGTVAIPAGKLVHWVRSQRKDGDTKSFSNAEKDDAYLSDVMEGIAALIGSGHVQGLPTKVNKFGKVESFTNGVPGSLRLATKTYGEKEYGKAKRLESEPGRREPVAGPPSQDNRATDHEAVAVDQAKHDDYFTPEDREVRDLVVDDKPVKPRGKMREQRASDTGVSGQEQLSKERHSASLPAEDNGLASGQFKKTIHEIATAKYQKPTASGGLVTRVRSDLGEGADGRTGNGPIRADVSGQIGYEAKTDATDATPLDFFPKQEEGVAPDDFSDQQFLTRQSNPRFEGGPEPKGTAASSASFRASKINEAFLNDPAKGQEMIKQRIRAAMRPEYVEGPKDGKLTMPGVAGKDQVVGGVHYIAPVAAFINAENLAANNIDLAAPAISAIQSRVAKLLLGGEISKEQKVAIAKLMSADPATITAMNVDAKLQRLVDGGQPKSAAVAPKPESNESKMNGILSEINTKRLAAKEVAAGLGKPSGGVDLGGTGQYAAKDQAKADQATKFIGRGSAASSTAKYAKAFGDRANTGKYTSSDTVFVSAEGNRSGRVAPNAAEIAKAMNAGATIITDDSDNRKRMHNVGERQVAAQLADGGYAEAKPGLWVPAKEKQNAQKGGPSRIATQAEMDQAKAYADKIFGKDGVKLDFQAITGHSGEFIDTTNTIVISTTAAAGTLGTLYHEAMHKFFAQYIRSNPKLQTVFEDLVDDPKHLARLHALLNGYPAAQAQLASGEERLAYTYQFWKAGLLQVDAKATTWMQKVGKFFRRILGTVRQSERALEIFQAFDNGKMSEPSAAGRVVASALGKGTLTIKMRRHLDGLMQGLAAATMPAAEILGKSVSQKARALSTMLFTNPGDGDHGEKGTGLMNARSTMAKQFINRASSRFETMSETDQAAVQKYLQTETDPAKIANPEHRDAVKEIRALLDEFHGYMVKAGMKIGKIESYYPTVWNGNALMNKKDEFINMLVMNYANEMKAIKPGVNTKMKNLPPSAYSPKDAATRIWQSLVDRGGVDAHLPAGREDGVLNPFFASQEARTLPWLRGEHKEAFLEKDMATTLTRYFSQGTKATEYFRRFGKDGTRLDDMLNGTKELGPQGFPTKVNGEYVRAADGIIHELKSAAEEMGRRGDLKDADAQAKWVSRQMRDISMSVGAMEGSLGKDVSPGMRKFNSWMTVYQNVRLLPMSLFSSFVDPLAIVARGAPLQAAYETFTYGLREVFRGWADAFKDMPPERQKDEWRQLAEHIGSAEVAMFSHHVGTEYGSSYMSSGARKINDKMFVVNGMEAWNRSNRIMATKWATRFLEKHAAVADPHHSERWLKELGLTPDMITLDQGKLVTDKEQLAALRGITVEQADRELAPIYQALNRWVEGAVLTPNAAQRPAWSSDPNYATMFHLKQFSYSFHQTILKRATNEFKHGNMAPVGALAMFIPTMIGADLIKGLIQGAGSLPPYMAGMNAGDWFMHGTQRAGLSGIGVIGTDAMVDPSSLGGPAFEQAVDAMRDGFGAKTLLQAAPLHALYGQALK